MFVQKRWSFGLGTIFSLIVVYFIFLYSREKGWTLLAGISKWYLIIIGGLIAISLVLIMLVLLFTLLMILFAMHKAHFVGRSYRKQKPKEYTDIEYKVKK